MIIISCMLRKDKNVPETSANIIQKCFEKVKEKIYSKKSVAAKHVRGIAHQVAEARETRRKFS